MGSPVGKAWMPMSVTRPNVDQAAFTLLELLVVLVIVGAIAAVALPGLVRMQETWARRTALDDLFNQLQTLGYRVRSDGRELLIDESGAVPEQLLRLPDGWTVTARPPIYDVTLFRVVANIRAGDGTPQTLQLELPGYVVIPARLGDGP